LPHATKHVAVPPLDAGRVKRPFVPFLHKPVAVATLPNRDVLPRQRFRFAVFIDKANTGFVSVRLLTVTKGKSFISFDFKQNGFSWAMDMLS
jgi:hypothetical protein